MVVDGFNRGGQAKSICWEYRIDSFVVPVSLLLTTGGGMKRSGQQQRLLLSVSTCQVVAGPKASPSSAFVSIFHLQSLLPLLFLLSFYSLLFPGREYVHVRRVDFRGTVQYCRVDIQDVW